MGVWFNEEANVSIANDLTIEQRKKLWACTVSIMDVSCKPPQVPEKPLTYILGRHFFHRVQVPDAFAQDSPLPIRHHVGTLPYSPMRNA